MNSRSSSSLVDVSGGLAGLEMRLWEFRGSLGEFGWEISTERSGRWYLDLFSLGGNSLELTSEDETSRLPNRKFLGIIGDCMVMITEYEFEWFLGTRYWLYAVGSCYFRFICSASLHLQYWRISFSLKTFGENQ